MNRERKFDEVFSKLHRKFESNCSCTFSKKSIFLTPTQTMHDFQRLLPLGLDVVDNRLLSINGYLSREGVLHACKFLCHQPLMLELGFKSEVELEQAGWIKLANMNWFTFGRFCAIKPTREQKQTIELWYRRNGLPISHFEQLF